MNIKRRQARQYLNDASKTTFWNIVEEAKISDEDMKVLDLKFIHGHGNVEISMELKMSVEKVDKIIARSYDKVARLL